MYSLPKFKTNIWSEVTVRLRIPHLLFGVNSISRRGDTLRWVLSEVQAGESSAALLLPLIPILIK